MLFATASVLFVKTTGLTAHASIPLFSAYQNVLKSSFVFSPYSSVYLMPLITGTKATVSKAVSKYAPVYSSSWLPQDTELSPVLVPCLTLP